jgi:MYXO-CTERM domain-containing protein
MKSSLVVAACLVASSVPVTAHAFCGFYVGGAGQTLYNRATEVVLMRAGTRTVLAMQNHYQGPPEHFAMVVPVPVVLHDGDVKTLPADVFAKVDAMGSPRLVEYWEQDPCYEPPKWDGRVYMSAPPTPSAAVPTPDHGVTIEARFAVGEYDVAILSASESTGLDTYLREQHYDIPAGAEPLLRPYVEGGMKFFVAKVDPARVKLVDGQATLSPLRFHYDSDDFALPIRLGLANSDGTQDLIVNILAADRYEVADYPNVTIPTNLEVRDDVRTRFAEFYAALFDRTVATTPGAVVTEYSWNATTCDPCPGPTLDAGDLATLGGDIVGADVAASFTLTRLHARYGKDGAPNDLVFRTAAPILGGREDAPGNAASSAPVNNFQGRYIIRHPWTEPVTCRHPHRGTWGGPPDGSTAMQAASNLAFAPRNGMKLDAVVAQEVPAIGVHGTPIPTASLQVQGCACQSSTGGGNAAILGGVVLLVVRRRRAT